MNNLVDEFMSNISPSAYSFHEDFSTNTITISLNTAFMGKAIIGNQELENLTKDTKQQDVTYAIKRNVAEYVVRQMLGSMGITNKDVYKLELVRDIPIEDVLKLKGLAND